MTREVPLNDQDMQAMNAAMATLSEFFDSFVVVGILPEGVNKADEGEPIVCARRVHPRHVETGVERAMSDAFNNHMTDGKGKLQ